MPRGLDARETAALVLTAAYNVAVNRALPPASHLPANLSASALLLLLARDGEVGIGELGLAPDRTGHGVRTGLAVGAIAAAGVAAVAAARPARRLFVDQRVADHSTAELAYHTLLRIPLATALGEELVFRAALLGLFSRRRSRLGAVALSSAAFGLWHILPTLADLDPADTIGHRVAMVGGVVVVTAVAGGAFAALRLRTGSVLAPAIVHTAINVTALVATRLLSRPRPAALA